jgi:hypothetical protein
MRRLRCESLRRGDLCTSVPSEYRWLAQNAPSHQHCSYDCEVGRYTQYHDQRSGNEVCFASNRISYPHGGH